MPVATLVWNEGALRLIDQTKLPEDEVYIECKDVETVAERSKASECAGHLRSALQRPTAS